jgi:hypothetical protein
MHLMPTKGLMEIFTNDIMFEQLFERTELEDQAINDD